MNKKDVEQVEKFIQLAKDTMDSMDKILEELKTNKTINQSIGLAYDRMLDISEEYVVGMTLAITKLGLDAVLTYKEE